MPDDEQPQNSHEPERTPWFGQRGNGGYRPQTWQGAIVAVVIVFFSVVASRKDASHRRRCLSFPSLRFRPSFAGATESDDGPFRFDLGVDNVETLNE
jgi:hypothetical protein